MDTQSVPSRTLETITSPAGHWARNNPGQHARAHFLPNYPNSNVCILPCTAYCGRLVRNTWPAQRGSQICDVCWERLRRSTP